MKKTILLIPFLVIALASCGSSIDDKTIIVGASSTPHALILEQTKDYIKEKGYTLDIKVMTDYVTPNLSLESGDLDANYFQHEPYLNDFNAAYGTDLISVKKIHFEPLGIYAGKKSNLDDIKPTDKIAIPNDTSNKARAIDLLSEHGLEGCELIEMEAQSIPTTLSDVEYAVINGNYALSSNVISKVIVTESTESAIANTMANIIAVKKGNENKPAINLLIEAICRDEIKDYIRLTFGSSVIPMF